MLERENLTKNQARYGAPGEIRTPDPLVRSQVLYPTELRAHLKNCPINTTNYPDIVSLDPRFRGEPRLADLATDAA